jgi:hypothetical protein
LNTVTGDGSRLHYSLNANLTNLSAWLGLGFIAVGVQFASGVGYPGWWGLLPTLGTCLLIYAGSEAWLNRVVFSNPVLVWIGLISYPLYLWHWPILSFIHVLHGGPGPAMVRTAAVLAAFGLAALTYELVEKPIRFGVSRNAKAVALGAMLICVGCIGAATYVLQGIASRSVAQANLNTYSDLAVPVSSRSSDFSCPKLLDIEPDPNEVCLSNAENPQLLILGDSTAMAFNSAAYAGAINLSTALVSTHAHIWGAAECMGGLSFEDWLQSKNTCTDIVKQAIKIARDRRSIDSVVISFALEDQFTYERSIFLGIQNALLKLHKKVTYLLVPPLFHIEPSSCIARVTVLGTFDRPSESCRQKREYLENDQARYRAYIDGLRKANSEVSVYDSFASLCGAQSCSVTDESGSIYFIDGHVNPRGSARLLSDFLTWSKRSGSR